MKFKTAIKRTVEIAPYLRNRLDALTSAHQSSIHTTNPNRITGSVDIDAALQSAYPNDNRWDYAIGCYISNQEDKVFFVEFHRAIVEEVLLVLKKKQWLERWMYDKPINNLRKRKFIWVSAGGINIPSNSPQIRNLNTHGIQLVRRLKLG
jgi:hypothetical protein